MILNLLPSAKTLFPNEVTFIGSGWRYLLEDHHSTHNIVLEWNFSVNLFRIRAIPRTRPKVWP